MSESAVVFCTYCLAHNNRTTAVMGMVIPTPNGDVPVQLCRRHLDAMVTDLVAAQRTLDAAKPLVVPPKRNLRAVSPC